MTFTEYLTIIWKSYKVGIIGLGILLLILWVLEGGIRRVKQNIKRREQRWN